MSTNSKIVRVAGGQGFWGDWLDAPRRQVEGGPVDYLMLDYLAEVTMSISSPRDHSPTDFLPGLPMANGSSSRAHATAVGSSTP